MKKIAFIFCVASTSLYAAPQLKTQGEVVADGELKVKVLANSRGIPAPTLKAQFLKASRGGEEQQLKWYSISEVWRGRAFAGMWKDKKDNEMHLARVLSLPPSVEQQFQGYADKSDIEKKLDEDEKAFKGTEEELSAWKSAWGAKGEGDFFTKNGKTYWVEFVIKEKMRPGETEKLIKNFVKSVASASKLGGGNISSMKWWEQANDQYKFMTDLDRAKGGKFISVAMSMMDAMRRSYEFYVPPTNSVGLCTVRVFKTLAGYREYRSSTGTEDKMSCGLWDPNREELLISAENPKDAQNTMRHEAFHQYLHYATKRGDHAMWFNEGHACFFENVKYNPAKKTVTVVDTGNRAMWVSKNPAKYANAIKSVLKKSHDEFYSGDVNLNYCTAWAVTYFLEKGAWTSEEFASYRQICPTYLELMAAGASAKEATEQAWALVKDRDVAADFLKFWKEKRGRAVNAR